VRTDLAYATSLSLCAIVVLCGCSTHVLSQSGPDLEGSRVMHSQLRLDVLTEPTVESPAARLVSTRESRVEQRFVQKTVFKRSLSRWGMLGYLTAASVGIGLAVDMNDKGFEKDAIVTASSSATILVAGLLLDWVGPMINWTKTRVRVDTVTEIEPVSVQVLVDGRLAASLSPSEQGMATFDLREQLTALGGSPRDLVLMARMQGTDTVSRSFSVSERVFASAVEQHRAEVERQEREAREQRLAQERAEREERERKAQAAAAAAAILDNVVKSMDQWDRARFTTALMYADAGFQYYIVDKGSALGIKTYGDFLNLPLRSQIDIVRQLAHMAGGEGYGASMMLQSLLKIPAYLAEEILK
jgi:hypothetical protein